jgi:GTPase Era involved in 16S rRNA processing/gas vesicle protein
MSDYISDSLKKFKEKKDNCLKYIDEVEAVYNDYLQDFPPSKEDESDNKSHTSNSSEFSSEKLGIGNFIDQLKNLRNKISTETLKIMIAGQFKAGKSTSLNALLECDVLPAYSTPCTAVITEIYYAEKPKAVIEFKPDIKEIPDDLCDKAAKHINRHKPNVPPITIEATGTSPDEIEDFRNELEDYLVIPMSDKDQEDSVVESPYKLCQLYWPLELSKQGVVIIDSPGLNENQARTDTTLGYLREADMIFHVLSALQCYGLADKSFVEQVKVVSSETPLLFMVNRFDQLNKDRERDRVRDYVRKNVSPQSTYGMEGVFFLSAQEALDGKLEHDDSKLNSSGFVDFEKKVADIINRERGKIKLGNVKVLNEKLNSIITDEIPSLKTLLSKTAEELAKKLKNNDKEFKKLDEILQRMEQTVIKGIARIERDVKSGLNEKISDFISYQLKNVIDDTSFNISWLNKKEDTEKAGKIIGKAVDTALSNLMTKWSSTELPQILNEEITDIQEQVEYDLSRFSDGIEAIRKDFNLHASNGVSFSEVGSDCFIAAGIAGGLLGGVAGGLGAFVASRLLCLIGGPVGVAIGLGSAIVAGLWAMISGSGAEEDFKKNAFSEIREHLYSKKSEICETASREVKANFESATQKLVARHREEIDKIKAPILKAIEEAKKEEKVRMQKAKKLDVYIERLKETLKKGENLVCNL